VRQWIVRSAVIGHDSSQNTEIPIPQINTFLPIRPIFSVFWRC